MDLHTKKIVGYSFGRKMTTELIGKALENAYQTQQPSEGLIFHSDLGTQYTSDDFRAMIIRYKMKHSFSYKGSPYDNVCTESFHAILKKEEVNHKRYIDKRAAELARQFVQEEQLAIVVSDLTYVRVGSKCHYVCLFVDPYNR